MTSTVLSGFAVTAPAAPTVSIGTASGSLDASAVYGYKVTFVTAFGETESSSAGSQTTTSTGSLNITFAISTDSNVTQRKLYRTAGGGSSYLLLTTIDDNLTTTYVDTIADGSLTDAAPTSNTAMARQSIQGIAKMAMPINYSLASAVAFATGGQTNATQLTSEYSIITVCASAADSVKLPLLTANTIGMRIVVCNDGIASCNVFPSLGQDASGGTNTAVAVANAARAEFVAKSATAWEKVR